MSESLQTIELQLHALWLQAQEGDAASYARALKVISGYLRRYLNRRMQSQPSDVEDLVQETLLAIHQKRHTYQAEQAFTAWMYAIARYKWIDHLRAHGRREALHDDIDDWSEVLAASSETEVADSRRDLSHMLTLLPDKQRLAIEHTKLQGLSITETATLTGQSEAAVKVNVHRGLKALATQWREKP
jgi:RNA polymerase sigma-70 factor (ECF subfamily)